MAGVGQRRRRGQWASPMPPLSLRCLGKQPEALCTKRRKILAWSGSTSFGVILLCALLNRKKIGNSGTPAAAVESVKHVVYPHKHLCLTISKYY